MVNIKKSVDLLNVQLKTDSKKLAQYIGISESNLSYILRINSPKHIKVMAEFYHLPVSAFIETGE